MTYEISLATHEMELLTHLKASSRAMTLKQAVSRFKREHLPFKGEVEDALILFGRLGILRVDYGGHEDDPVFSIYERAVRS